MRCALITAAGGRALDTPAARCLLLQTHVGLLVAGAAAVADRCLLGRPS
jgi:hypothetical protein